MVREVPAAPTLGEPLPFAHEWKKLSIDGTWTYNDEIARQLVTRAAAGEEPYFSAYLNRVYPIVRKVEADARVAAVKTWVEIVREHEERKQQKRGPEQGAVNDQPRSPPAAAQPIPVPALR